MAPQRRSARQRALQQAPGQVQGAATAALANSSPDSHPVADQQDNGEEQCLKPGLFRDSQGQSGIVLAGMCCL
jgi:hypothetical protein